MKDFLETTWLDNTLLTWAIALGVGLATFAVCLVLARIVPKRLKKLAARTAVRWDDLLVEALGRTGTWFLLAIAAFAGSLVLGLSERFHAAAGAVIRVALVLQAGFWISAAIRYWVKAFREQRLQDDPAAVTSVGAMGFVSRLVLWVLVALLVLDNAGVEIGPLLAGLGVGGIAVALAVQNVLGDLFASLSIVLDKPFVIGDFLILGGEHLGSVENIGLKTTRVRSLSGEQLVLSNSDLLNSRIRNFGRMTERRVVFSVGILYSTPRETVARVAGMIRSAIEAQPDVRFDRAHFKEFGDSALVFEAVYYVLSPAYNVYMDRQQAINLALMEAFELEGIEFAFPTRTLHIESGSSAATEP